MIQFMNFQGPTFTMQVPTDWLITSSPKLQAIFVAPQNENSTNDAQIQPNLIVSIRRLTEGTTAQAIAESTKATQQKEYAAYQIVNEQEFSKDDSSAVYRAYTWLKGDENVTVYQQQTFFVKAQVLYTLTATRPESKNMAHIDELFSRMFQSFQITE